MQTLLYGAQIITQNEQDEIHKEGWILLEDDRIIGIGAGAPRRFRMAPSSAAFPVGSSCPASSISTPM